MTCRSISTEASVSTTNININIGIRYSLSVTADSTGHRTDIKQERQTDV